MIFKKTIEECYPHCPTWPFWMMRQAGRTLPEYRAIREKNHSFLDLVTSPALVAEITLQPLKRFDVDAAIIFSDILLPLSSIPGITLSFQNKSSPIIHIEEKSLKKIEDHVYALQSTDLYGVLEGIDRVKSQLSHQQLIGFCGGPWTVAAYLWGSRSPLDWPQIQKKIEQISPEDQDRWIGILTHLLLNTLLDQHKAGATQCMIFDSWSAYVPLSLQRKWLRDPLIKIAKIFKEQHPDCPLIYYSRGVLPIVMEWGAAFDIVACDSDINMGLFQNQPYIFQGNLNPLWISLPAEQCEEKIVQWKEQLIKPVVVNLGSGLDPSITLPDLTRFVSLVRKHTKEL